MNRVATMGPGEGAEVTAREAEVLALVARHLTNAQIAEALVISQRTVESHVSAMLRKLQLPDRRSLARFAGAMPGLLVKSGRRGLPQTVTSFIGRSGERAALAAALAEHRLVTATGPGGIGKTRLALSVACELAPTRQHGAWFVDLVHVTDPGMVTAAVAETVGVPEQRMMSVDRALVASLADRDALLVLDNCEHVLDGVRACIERILAGAPEVTVLATSRIRLLLPYESVFVVPGLSVVDAGGDAVDLFAARLTAATGEAAPPDTGRVAALCQALEGVALAIELAAARFATLGLDGLEAGLDQRLRFLTAGARVADRHGSLREAIDWSYNLLAPDDRALLRGIAVFASWFDVDAAGAVVAGSGRDRAEIADGLARLAEHSLLVVERGEPTRYRAADTIRQYGVERLGQAGELDQTRASHERWCRLAVATLRRSEAAEIDEAWCDRFDRVAGDVDATVAWTAGDETRRARAAELAAELAGLMFARGRPAQAQRRYEQAADLAPLPADRSASYASPAARPRVATPATTHCGSYAPRRTLHWRSTTVPAPPPPWPGCRSTWTGNRESWPTPAPERLLCCARKQVGPPTPPCSRRRPLPRRRRGAPATAIPRHSTLLTRRSDWRAMLATVSWSALHSTMSAASTRTWTGRGRRDRP